MRDTRQQRVLAARHQSTDALWSTGAKHIGGASHAALRRFHAATLGEKTVVFKSSVPRRCQWMTSSTISSFSTGDAPRLMSAMKTGSGVTRTSDFATNWSINELS